MNDELNLDIFHRGFRDGRIHGKSGKLCGKSGGTGGDAELEEFDGHRLDGADVTDDDGGGVEVFAANGGASEAAKHGELAGVGESIGDGALQEAVGGSLERSGRGQTGVECGERSEEAFLLAGPIEWLGAVPCGIALGHGKRPAEQVAHVGENHNGSTACAFEVGEGRGRVFKGASRAISKSGESVAKELSFFVHEKTLGARAVRMGEL